MKFEETDIKEFVALWQKEFGQEIEYGDAELAAAAFIEACNLIIQPFPSEPDYSGVPLITL